MKIACRLRALLLPVAIFAAMTAPNFPAAPREVEWKKVGEAMAKDQPKTAIELLGGIEAAAIADQSWGETAKAIVMRVGLGGRIEGGPEAGLKAMDAELAKAPDGVKPLLKVIQAHWFHTYYQNNQWQFAQRSATSQPPGDDIETWDLARILAEVDNRFQAALEGKDTIRTQTIGLFKDVLSEAALGDATRPSLYDFIAHQAIEFYSMEEVAASRPQDAFRIAATDPAFGSVDEFLAWKPETKDTNAPAYRALVIYQELLNWHQQDADRAAFFHCDLARIRWASEAAIGQEKPARREAALRAFIEKAAADPASADARMDLAQMLTEAGKFKDARDIAKAGAAAFPSQLFGKRLASFVAQTEAPSLNLQIESSWTPSGSPIKVDYRNLNRVHFRAYPRKWSMNSNTIDNDPLPEEDKDVIALLKDKPVISWDVPLPDDGDFRPRTAHLVAPESLAPGFYWIVASGHESFKAKQNGLSVACVHVTDLAMIIRYAYGSNVAEGVVTDALSGEPVSGVEVTMAYDRNRMPGTSKESTRSGEDGAFSFKIGKEHNHRLFMAERAGNRALVRQYAGAYERSEGPDTRDAIVFFTDRSIYRPGQTIQFKGIWCRTNTKTNEYSTVAGATTTVVFIDMNGREVEKLEVTTNQNGSFAGSFTAPSGAVLGRFVIQCPKGATSVRVEEYKRPKFASEILPPEQAAALGQKVMVKAKATAYTGAAVDGAKVVWRVSRQPRWPGWIGYCWWFRMPMNTEAQEIAHGEGVTTADGTFALSFDALPDKSIDPASEPIFDFSITADITDQAGETRSATYSLALAYTALTASIVPPQWIEAGKEFALDVDTASHDGQPMPADGVLRIHRLKEPSVTPRPNPFEEGGNPIPLARGEIDPAANEDAQPESANPDRWELGDIAADARVQTAAEGEEKGSGAAKFTLAPGYYRAIYQTKDANGRDVQAMTGFHVLDSNGTDFPTHIPFHTDSPDTILEPGETFSFVWGSGYEKARALVEWYQNGKMVHREWSAPGRTQQSFSWKVEEKDRGGFSVRVSQMTMNSLQTKVLRVDVPWTTKELKLRWEHITDKLQPGAKDTWTAIITGADGEAAVAEMVATLYDASLDAFAPHSFSSISGMFRRDPWIHDQNSFSTGRGYFRAYFGWEFETHTEPDEPLYREFSQDVQIFGRQHYGRPMPMMMRSKNGGEGIALGAAADMDPFSAPPAPAAAMAPMEEAAPFGGAAKMASMRADAPDDAFAAGGGAAPKPDASKVAARKNLQETAFFFPQLTSNEKGEVRMSFTMPEALTEWKFLGLAHDSSMRSGWLEGKTVTAKDLMVQPNPPRFLREGDEIEFSVRITNLSDKAQSGTARFTLADGATLADATARLGVTTPDQSFEVPAKESRALTWKLNVPDGSGFLQYKAVATSGDLSDGEQGWLPVIPRRIVVTESLALPVRGAGEKKFSFDKLRASGPSDSLQTQFLHVQAVSQPAWYAVLALPYLMEFPHECAEQTFNRYYANALARHIALSDPKIRDIFEQWKGTEALDSPLLKNEDLKGILIEETPWLREANDQSAARRRIALLFDDNHMADQLGRALERLNQMQHHDGLFPWFDGGRGSEFITLNIVTGFARLRALGVETDITPALQALPALDRALSERYREIKKNKGLDNNNLDPWIAHHLYTRTFFLKDVAPQPADKVAFDYFQGQAVKHWASLKSRMARAHVALGLHRLGETEVPKLITRSFRENAVSNEEMGMWWKDSEGEGWWWWNAPIETQAMMVEAFREIDADEKAVEDCQVWLIKQKQVQDWKTTKATSDAVYALLLGGKNLLGSDALIQISLGTLEVKPGQVEPGTGMYEVRFPGPEVKPEFGDITVKKTDEGVSWASVHWQYLEDMAKVSAHTATPLKLEKALFIKKNTARGKELVPLDGPVKVGDELVTRLVLRNDRAMEFLHLKDYRGSGCEPINVLSGYRWQDGFGYYEVTRDTASHFFIDYLPPGTHVFESSVRVQHAGRYQTGIAEIRSMYAPEFNAHSASIKLEASK